MTAFVGRNGQGKTNLVEAIDYLVPARLAPGRRRRAAGAGRRRPGRGPRGRGPRRARRRCSRSRSTRAGPTGPGSTGRRCPGPASCSAWCARCSSRPRTWPWSRATPSERRRFLDDLLVLRAPRLPASAPTTTGCSSSATRCSRPPAPRAAGRSREESALSTLGVWDAHLARTGAELLAERLRLVDELRPYVGNAYATVARGATQRRRRPRVPAQPRRSRDLDRAAPDARPTRLLAELERRRADELDRGISLVGPAPRRAAAHPRQRRSGQRPAAGAGATPPTASPGRSRSRCGWRRTTCCGPTATTRS